MVVDGDKKNSKGSNNSDSEDTVMYRRCNISPVMMMVTTMVMTV